MTKETWSDYTLDQLEALMTSTYFSTLERNDLRRIIDELLKRCRTLHDVVDRY